MAKEQRFTRKMSFSEEKAMQVMKRNGHVVHSKINLLIYSVKKEYGTAQSVRTLSYWMNNLRIEFRFLVKDE
jgi:hypothetical protein